MRREAGLEKGYVKVEKGENDKEIKLWWDFVVLSDQGGVTRASIVSSSTAP